MSRRIAFRGRVHRTALSAALACLATAALAAPATVAAAEKVRVVRDSRGEPHIQAASARGAMYGFAWAQMEDQAPYILGFINHAVGRSAERIGPDCTPSLQACFRLDQLARLFRVPETAYERYGSLPAENRARFEAFADGINAYIDSRAGNLPSWAAHVTPQDVLATVEYPFVMTQVREAGEILRRGGGRGDDGEALAGTGEGTGAGRTASATFAAAAPPLELPASNMFALTGRKTASGKPILQGDPHLPFDGASRWYAAQLAYPGNRVRGVTFRGLPGIAMGSNDHVAWSFTANHTTQHEQDVYVERLKPANRDQYLYGGSYRDMVVRRVVMRVKTASGELRPIAVRLRYTVHGPVLSDPLAGSDGSQGPPLPNVAFAAKVSEYGEVGLATQLWRASEARSVAEFKRAFSLNQLAGFNTLVADQAGNIFFVATSRSGILNPGVRPNSLLDGSDPRNDWQGILPFERLPQAQNPRSGYYQNANNAPWFTAPDQIREEDVPFYLRGGGNTSRSRRLVQLLGPQTTLGPPFNLTISDTERIGMDTFLEFGPSLRALLDQAAAVAGADPKVKEAAALIDRWPGARDLYATTGSTAYPLFATWKRGLRPSVLGFNPNNPPPPTTAFTAAQKAEASRAMVVAYDGMMRQYNTIAVPYGRLHTLTWGSFTAPVNGGDFDLPTVRMSNCRNDPGSQSPVYYHPCAVKGGSSNIFNVDLATGRFTVSRPVSNTDDPSSPFYTLNARDYVADRYRAFPVTDRALDAEKTSSRKLTVPRRRCEPRPPPGSSSRSRPAKPRPHC